jgi:hypothetical protein
MRYGNFIKRRKEQGGSVMRHGAPPDGVSFDARFLLANDGQYGQR